MVLGEMTNSFSSFRDPGGRVFISGKRVIRAINKEGSRTLIPFLNSALASQLIASGQLVKTFMLDSSAGSGFVVGEIVNNTEILLEHEKIPFPSYPYEWPPEMLLSAGRLTLRLAELLQRNGIGLKDATPYNVLFRGSTPVFVDLLSIERRDERDPIWQAEAQFERTFVLPLLANASLGFSLGEVFLVHRDGLEPEKLYRMSSSLQKISSLFFRFVTLPALLGKTQRPGKNDAYRPRRSADKERAQFALRFLYRRLNRHLTRLETRLSRTSHWVDYMSHNTYDAEQFALKCRFVEDTLSECAPRQTLDVGCNIGHFSLMAAKCGSSVVATDIDPAVVGTVWHSARRANLEILPLVVDISRPSPRLGWRNTEQPSFLERATGYFDLVLMLGIIHHLLVNERIPLEEILDLASTLTTKYLLIEFIGPEDAMFLHLVRGREKLFGFYSREYFETGCHKYFDLVRSVRIGESQRWLYLLKKREACQGQPRDFLEQTRVSSQSVVSALG